MSLGAGCFKGGRAWRTEGGVVTMATMQVLTTQYHHTENFSGILTDPQNLPDMRVGREGAEIQQPLKPLKANLSATTSQTKQAHVNKPDDSAATPRKACLPRMQPIANKALFRG